MPRMGGIEFLRELRKDPDLSALTVIILTTSDEDRDKVGGLQAQRRRLTSSNR
jgi:CheY-like chemotaxis protein